MIKLPALLQYISETDTGAYRSFQEAHLLLTVFFFFFFAKVRIHDEIGSFLHKASE